MGKLSISSNVIGPELLKILGISSEELIKAVITIEAGKCVIIACEYVGGLDMDKDPIELKRIMKQYEVVER